MKVIFYATFSMPHILYFLYYISYFAFSISGIGRGGKIRNFPHPAKRRPESQCRQTIVCDCELPVFAPARTSDALLRGSAVRDENAAAKHQAYTV